MGTRRAFEFVLSGVSEMQQRLWLFGLLALSYLALGEAARGEDPLPRSTDPQLKIELFAEHPQIVTPTGIDIDQQGRVWAIESNTHFPPEGYVGHKTDRLLVLRDANHDGRADEITVFADGFTHAMSVAVRPIWFPVPAQKTEKGEIASPKLSVYVATRREILLLHDDDGDLKADRQERLVHLETTGNYPHNGLAGFAFDAVGWMFFGFGENLGADYKVIGADGKTLTGGGEGGSIYRTRLDGSQLSRWSTGFWNPHASCIDAFGRMFSVDNDPDSRPPCRLLHIIPGGDYGYRFRNGRKGLHPFTAWNGEIPGTLPMVAGTGEAPSGIIAYESDGLPKDYVGNLLVGSWGDHRIDRFKLKAKGSSFTSLAEPLITGNENFRPVGLAVAPDGSVFCTDWVSREYKLHGKGRIWRISAVQPPSRAVQSIDKLAGVSEIQLYDRLHSSNGPIRRAAAFYLGKTVAGRSLLVNQFADSTQSNRSRLEALWATVNLALENDPPTDLLVAVRSLSAATSFTTNGLSRESGQRLGGEVKCASDWLRGTNPSESILYRQILDLARRTTSGSYGLDEVPSSLSLASKVRHSDGPVFRIQDPFSFSSVEDWADPFQLTLILDSLEQVEDVEMFRAWWTSLQSATPPQGPEPLDARALQELMRNALPEQRQAILNQRRNRRQFEQSNRLMGHERVGLALLARRRFPKDQELVSLFLKDSEPLVKRLAVQWTAEEKFKDLRPLVEAILTNPDLTSDLFLATLAALEMLDGVNPVEFDKTPASKYVLPLVQKDGPPAVRALALRMVSPNDPALTLELFQKLLASPDERLKLEAIRTLQLSSLPNAVELLAAIAGDAGQSVLARAEAIAGLTTAVRSPSPDNAARKILNKILLGGDKPALKIEALRTLRGSAANSPEALVIKRLDESLPQTAQLANGRPLVQDVPVNPAGGFGGAPGRGGRGGRGGVFSFDPTSEMKEQIQRALADSRQPPRAGDLSSPTATPVRTVQDWNVILGLGSGSNFAGGIVQEVPNGTPPDVDAGRRTFFHANSAGCFKCHTIDGRGGKVGPDLTTIARTMDRVKLVQSILDPSREISPQFVSWNFELTSGQTLQGLLISEESEKLKIASVDGKVHDLTLKEIETRAPQSVSLMPEKLADQLTPQEFLDLIAFLETLK